MEETGDKRVFSPKNEHPPLDWDNMLKALEEVIDHKLSTGRPRQIRVVFRK